MSAARIAEATLVALAVGLELLSCAGLVLMRKAVDRLHYAAAASTLPPVLVAAAVWVEEGFTAPSLNAVVVAATLLVLNSVLTNAVIRAARGKPE